MRSMLSSRRLVATMAAVILSIVSQRAASFSCRTATELSFRAVSSSSSKESIGFVGLSSSAASLEEEVDPGVVEGTDLRIVKYPHPSLRSENAIITEDELKDGSISKLAKEMFLVMYAAQGVGLAAPQVGVNKRLMVYNPTGDAKKWLDEVVLVNPQIVKTSDGTDVETEGCLSFPDMNGNVQRHKWIQVQALTPKGRKVKKKFTGWEARIFQHEYDHLDGVVYIDHLTEEGRSEVQPRLDELVQDFGDGGAL